MEAEGFWKAFYKQDTNRVLCVSDLEGCPGF